MKKKILVTGATGNIGKNVIELLKEKNADFTAATTGKEIDGVNTVLINYSDPVSLEKAMEGISTLFMVLPNHPEMIKWGKNIINAAKKTGIKHIVRSSGSLADINSPLSIRQLLAKTDKDLIESGIDHTITSPSFFMENFINFFAEDYKKGAIYQPAGNGKISWISVKDIAAVNVEVLLNPEKYKGQNLEITGTESFDYNEAVNRINKITGKESNYVAISDEAATEAMKGMQFPDFVIDTMISLNQCIVQGFGEKATDVIEKILGRKPVTFDQFVNDNKEVWL